MRDVEEGFGLANVDGSEVDMNGVDMDADAGLDVGFDFLEDVDAAPEAGGKAAAAAPSAARDRISQEDVAEFRARWADVQASFIDDPQRACEQADNLVDLVLKRITEGLARERDGLVRKWDRGHEAMDTEDLRQAMKGYRGLVDRLLTTEL